jgi:hypothetical protein
VVRLAFLGQASLRSVWREGRVPGLHVCCAAKGTWKKQTKGGGSKKMNGWGGRAETRARSGRRFHNVCLRREDDMEGRKRGGGFGSMRQGREAGSRCREGEGRWLKGKDESPPLGGREGLPCSQTTCNAGLTRIAGPGCGVKRRGDGAQKADACNARGNATGRQS